MTIRRAPDRPGKVRLTACPFCGKPMEMNHNFPDHLVYECPEAQ